MSESSDVVGKITIPTKTINGKRLGCTPVKVSLGGTDLGGDCFAVILDKDLLDVSQERPRRLEQEAFGVSGCVSR